MKGSVTSFLHNTDKNELKIDCHLPRVTFNDYESPFNDMRSILNQKKLTNAVYMFYLQKYIKYLFSLSLDFMI